jgi:hypothetical protein|tara:strand:+ start:98 stop:388 length:291 start_codon:yes stop_codon:yes gene_type:complete
MKFEDILFNETTMPKGVQALMKFADFELSIIKNEMSYGGKSGLYEIAVYSETHNDQIEMPGITEEGDTVKGFLTEQEVLAIIKKMYLITGVEPTKH